MKNCIEIVEYLLMTGAKKKIISPNLKFITVGNASELFL